MDYFCSEKALPCMKTLTPEDITKFTYTEEIPSGHIFITDGFAESYLVAQSDMLPTSRLIVNEYEYYVIEYFENGIPSWLDPVPGTRIYEAEWKGSEWEFTKVAGI